jgi:DNA-binding response OmpR family regulator
MIATKLRVLYSEDDADSRELMVLVLEREGFEAICPDTPEEVLKLAQEEQFDAYLLDSWTPRISGFDLCRTIRGFDNLTPIIFYSAAAYQRDKEEAFAAGAQAYIDKPGGLEDVINAIRLIASSRQESAA